MAAGLVDAVMLAAHVKCPVRLEVPVVDHGAEPEDGLGSLDAPPGAGDIEVITDQVRRWAGSRASAWPKAARITSAASQATEPVSHLAVVTPASHSAA